MQLTHGATQPRDSSHGNRPMPPAGDRPDARAMPDAVRRILCDDGLGLDLLAQTAHYGDDDDIGDTLDAVRLMLTSGDFDALPDLAEEDETAQRLTELLAERACEGWYEAVVGYLRGLEASLAREVPGRAPVPACDDLDEQIRSVVFDLDFVNADDALEILGVIGSPAYVDLVIAEFSPRYDGDDVIWRDTQFKFEFLFDSGLFIWLYANVAEEFRGRRIGTRFFEAVEGLARDLGFRRFCVPGPNKPYWERVMGYTVDPLHQVGGDGGFIHEAYKEFPTR